MAEQQKEERKYFNEKVLKGKHELVQHVFYKRKRKLTRRYHHKRL
jgi:hypothetical protein